MIKFQGYQVESLSFNNQEEKADKIELGINSTHNVSYNYDDGICIGRDIIKISDKEDPDKFNMDIVVLSRFTIEPTDDQRKMHVESYKEAFPFVRATVAAIMMNCGMQPLYLPPVEMKEEDVQVNADMN
ncbi:MAG: protein-export chaperone SecB [Eubacteriaceae bacterium]|jgi:preprotein translocase subunit SecB|nr:protein-export chaperone SecB [Eubacteriaceae bacterium]